MKILHIASIKNSNYLGTAIVIPQHVKYQGLFAETYFLNVSNCKIDGLNRQIAYSGRITDAINELGGVDLVVFQDVYCTEFIKIAARLRKEKIQYIIVPHGCFTRGAQKKKRLKKILGNIVFKRFIDNSVALQFLSEREKEEFALKYKRDTFIGTNGISLPEKRKESFSKDGIKFIYIGRLDVFHKGLDIFIEAVAKCKDFLIANGCRFDMYGPDILGRGDQVRALLTKHGVSDIVTLHKEISGKEKEKALLSSDVFMQTSRFEGMPLGILEALSYGLPVVISEGTNLKTEVEDFGAGVVGATDADDLAESIKKIVAVKGEYEKMSDNAVRLVAEKFDWNKIAKETVAKYETLIKRENGRR